MSDAPRPQPIRTDIDPDELVIARIADATSKTTLLKIDAAQNAQVFVHGNNPTGSDTKLVLSETGHVNADGVYNATTNTFPSKNGLVSHTRTATPTDVQLVQRVTAVQGTTGTGANTVALDISLHDDSGNPYSAVNPLPTYAAPAAGTAVMDPKTHSSVAVNASDVHSYAVPAGKTLYSMGAIFSVSARFKAVVDYTLDGSTYTIIATFWTSASNPTVEINWVPEQFPIVGSATTAIRITVTNKDTLATDAYSTIFGVLR